jgi:hypothetical protein
LLPEQLERFNEALTPEEQAGFKLILGLAASGLAPQFGQSRTGRGDSTFGAVAATLARMQPYAARIPANGIVYRGRPDILTEEMLTSLQTEARELRPTAQPYEEHFLGCGAPIANRLATSPELLDLVTVHAGPVEATGVASFLFYDEEGQGIDPHIDTDVFALNVLTMLQHEVPEGQIMASTLFMFPPNAEPEPVNLQPGEMVIFFAGSVAHGRTRIKAGESVSILTFGFKPRVDLG